MKKGNLFVVSGPSGAGKSTICRLVRKMLNINLATSATTRKPREGEVNGRDYYFLTIPEFEEKLRNGEFLEHAKVHELFGDALMRTGKEEAAALQWAIAERLREKNAKD